MRMPDMQRALSRNGVAVCSANQAQQQTRGEKEQGCECGRQVRNRMHFIDPGGVCVDIRVLRAIRERVSLLNRCQTSGTPRTRTQSETLFRR
jgi:hypothetical protein